MFVVYETLLKIVFFSIGVLLYVCIRDVIDVVSVCIVRRGAVDAGLLVYGMCDSISISSFAVLNAVLRMHN